MDSTASTPIPPAKAGGWLVRVVAILGLLAAAVWAGWTIRLETELLALLPQELPSVRGLDLFQRQFASDREVLLVADETLTAEAREEMLEKLKPVLAALPGVESVEITGAEWLKSAPQLAAWALWNLPQEQFTRAVAALEDGPVRARLDELPSVLAGALDAEELQKRQLDPLGLLDTLTASSGAAASPESSPFQWTETPPHSLTITATRPLIAFDDCAKFCSAIKSAVQGTLPGETHLLLTGRPAFTAEISTQMRRDMRLMMGVAVVLVSLAFWAFYRTVRPLGWILLGQFLALGVGLITARLFIGSLNVISMGFACILLGISMDYSILVYHHFASSFREDGKVWRRLRRGIWFSAATTAAAFLVLVFSSVPGLRQLATLVATGLLASAWFATLLLPAAWSARPPKPLPFLERMSGAMARTMERRGRLLLAVVLLGSGVGAAWLMLHPASIYVPDLNKLQPEASDAVRGQMLLAKNDPSWGDGIYLVQGATWDEVRQGADELAARVTAGHSSPLSGFLPAPSRQRENRALWKGETAARLRAAFTEAGLGEEWSGPTTSLAEALDRAAAGDATAFRVVEPLLGKLHREENGLCRAVVRLPGAAEQPMPAGGLTLTHGEAFPVSWVALKEELNHSVTGDLWKLGLWVMVAITVLCALAQRSLRMVLLNYAALLMALLLLAALLALAGVALSPLSLLCIPLLLGLVIDYSLHVLMALEHERDFDQLYAHIGAPILLTGLSSCIGFGAPMLTSQPALQNFGWVMDLGVIAAVTSCLFLLPVIARRREK